MQVTHRMQSAGSEVDLHIVLGSLRTSVRHIPHVLRIQPLITSFPRLISSLTSQGRTHLVTAWLIFKQVTAQVSHAVSTAEGRSLIKNRTQYPWRGPAFLRCSQAKSMYVMADNLHWKMPSPWYNCKETLFTEAQSPE